MLELLERGGGRRPQREPALRHRLERVVGPQPFVLDHLVALERGARRRPAASAAKNRASNRRGIDGGVTQRESGTSRSVRRSQVELRRRAPGKGRLAARPAPSAPRGSVRPSGHVARVGEQHAGLLERPRGSRRCGLRDRPGRRQVAAERDGRLGLGVIADRATRLGSRIGGSTRPPGKTWTSGANAIDRAAGASAAPRARPRPAAAGRASRPDVARRARPGSLTRSGQRWAGRWPAGRETTRSRPRARPAAPRASVTGRRQTKPRQT